MALLPAAFALAAAAFFGLGVHMQKIALRDMGDAVGTVVSIGAMALLFWAIAPFVIDWGWWTTRAALLFAICGLLFPAISQRLQIASVQHVGPAIGAAIGSFAPLFAVLPAVLLLGEDFGPQATLGLAFLIAGLVLTAVMPGRLNRDWPLIALLLPLGASAARGIVQPISKVGFDEVPSAFFAALVMVTVSLPVTMLMAAVVGRPHRPGNRRGVVLFALNGLVIGAGILCLQAAISLGDVTTAAPLVSTTPLWAVLFGLVVFRHERLRPWHVLVSALVCLGAVLIVTR